MMPQTENSSRGTIFTILPEEYIQNYISTIMVEWQRRWNELLRYKNSFEPYRAKSHIEITTEFENLHALRQRLWYRDPTSNPRIAQKDYLPAQDLIEKGHYRTITNIAFAYNNTEKSYNASTIILRGHHFIALQEPSASSLNEFFKLLINHHSRVLVRVKTEEEFLTQGSIKYWEDRLHEEKGIPVLEMTVTEGMYNVAPVYIPYFYINDWVDNKAPNISALYQLVCQVRKTYKLLPQGGPIACHCASGVGRTGTFIAAYILADIIHQSPANPLSIEQVVLELSLQRPNLMGTVDQYLSLYQFVEHCLANTAL